MKVLLLNDVPKVGKKGEIVKVSDGFGRNFLIAKNLAVEETDGRARILINSEKIHKNQKEKMTLRYEENLQKLMKEFFVIKAKAGEGNKLYGSITSLDIAEELSKKLGEPVDKRWLKLEGHIKEIGTYEIEVRFPGGVKGKLKVKIEKID